MQLRTAVQIKRLRLKQLSMQAQRRAAIVVAKTATDVEAGAKNHCPVDTGYLKGSIQARQTGPAEWEIRVGAEYGIYVHDGTLAQRPRPFLSQAVEDARPGFEAAVNQLLRG